jgi:hypothetical protein
LPPPLPLGPPPGHQVLVKLPSLSALAASQLHGCISSHFAGKGFQRLRRLALHAVEPDACTCLAAQVPHVALAANVAHAPGGGGGGGGGAPAAAAAAGAPPPPPTPAPQPAAQPQPQGPQPAAQPQPQGQQTPQQGQQTQLHQQVQLMLQQQQQPAPAAAAPPPPPPPPPLAPLVERVGLLVALCPAMQQLSIGVASAAALRAVERHESLQQLVIYGDSPSSGGGNGGAAIGAGAGAGAAPGVHPAPPRGGGGAGRAGGARRAAAIDGHAWGLLKRGAPRLGRLTLMDADALLGGSPSPAVPLLALAEGGGLGELRLLKYASLSDEGLAVATMLMGSVRTLALGGCTVRARGRGAGAGAGRGGLGRAWALRLPAPACATPSRGSATPPSRKPQAPPTNPAPPFPPRPSRRA